MADCLLEVLDGPFERGEQDPELERSWVARVAPGLNTVFISEPRPDGKIWPHYLGPPDGVQHFPLEDDFS